MSHVVREWVSKLTWKQQTTLLCACRGVDGFSKDHVSKPLTRIYRHAVLKSADITGSTGFMAFYPNEIAKIIDQFMDFQLDSYPMHWLLHFTHAIEIIGYKHPDFDTRSFWMCLYVKIVKSLHLNPETEDQLDFRLQDGCRERE